MPKQIALLALGSRGDVQPYVALGRGLALAGHRVTLVAPAIFAPLAREHGLAFAPIQFNPQAELQKPHIQALLRQGPLKLSLNIGKIVRLSQQWYRQTFADFWQSTRDADLIVASSVAYGAQECAEKRGIPLVASHLAPLSPTRAFSNIFFAAARPLGPLNPLSHLLMEQASWLSVRAAINRWRDESLGLPRLGVFDTIYARTRAAGRPILYAYSPALIPKPADWAPQEVVTGYWFLDAPATFTPPAELVRFLRQGEPPICIGFGSMSDQQPERIAGLVQEAAALAGRRAIVLSGWAGLRSQRSDERIYWADALPHDWLFPQVAAVVHHGGAGTTGACLRAGVPAVVAPFLLDQFGWAEIVRRRGVGVRARPLARLGAAELAGAIRAATTSPAIGERAAALGRQIRAERGVDRAIAALGGLLA